MTESMQDQNPHSHPVRRCISCRMRGAKSAFLRFGVMQGAVHFDLRKKMPTRGYYTCAKESCLERASKGGFKRMAKADVALPVPLSQYLSEIIIPGLHKRYEECLLIGRQNGQLLVNTFAVEHAASQGQLMAYLLATDASESTRTKYTINAQRKDLPCLGLLDKATLGKLTGKGEKAVLGWLAGQVFEEFHFIEKSLQNLDKNLHVTIASPRGKETS